MSRKPRCLVRRDLAESSVVFAGVRLGPIATATNDEMRNSELPADLRGCGAFHFDEIRPQFVADILDLLTRTMGSYVSPCTWIDFCGKSLIAPRAIFKSFGSGRNS
jgi:hypothetical protein